MSMGPKLGDLFIVVIVPVLDPPCTRILFLETAEHGRRYRKILEHA